MLLFEESFLKYNTKVSNQTSPPKDELLSSLSSVHAGARLDSTAAGLSAILALNAGVWNNDVLYNEHTWRDDLAVGPDACLGTGSWSSENNIICLTPSHTEIKPAEDDNINIYKI